MTTKDDFTAEEWAEVDSLPGMVIGGAAMADGRKLISTIREVSAGAKALERGAAKYPDNALLQAMAKGSGKASLDGKPQNTEQLVTLIGDDVQKSWTILQSKATPEETAQIAEVLIAAGQAAVERTGSGHFGHGGEQVDAGEKAFMERITEILTATAPAADAAASPATSSAEAAAHDAAAADSAGQAQN